MFSLRSACLPAAAAAVVAFLGLTGAARATPTLLSTEKAPTIVAAYGATVMWSTLDQATGAYKLVKSVNGSAPAAVGVAERERPFDIDLGTNRSGSLYAVYSREGFIYRLHVTTGVEQKLTSLSLGGQSFNPSIQRGRIAFLHSGRGHDELRIGDTTSGAGKPKVVVRGVIDNVELGINQLTYTVFKDSRFGGSQTVHVRNIRTGHDKAIYRAASGGANTSLVTKPSFTADLGSFVWARTNVGSGAGNRIIRYTLAGGKLSYAQGSSRYATTAWAGGDLGAAFSTAEIPRTNQSCEDAGVSYCTVGFTGPLSFTLKP